MTLQEFRDEFEHEMVGAMLCGLLAKDLPATDQARRALAIPSKVRNLMVRMWEAMQKEEPKPNGRPAMPVTTRKG